MDGSEGPRAAAVERDLIAADASRKKRAAVIDQHAAIFILQGALDRLSNMPK
jgi:putative Holliday junction resolvase